MNGARGAGAAHLAKRKLPGEKCQAQRWPGSSVALTRIDVSPSGLQFAELSLARSYLLGESWAEPDVTVGPFSDARACASEKLDVG